MQTYFDLVQLQTQSVWFLTQIYCVTSSEVAYDAYFTYCIKMSPSQRQFRTLGTCGFREITSSESVSLIEQFDTCRKLFGSQ